MLTTFETELNKIDFHRFGQWEESQCFQNWICHKLNCIPLASQRNLSSSIKYIEKYWNECQSLTFQKNNQINLNFECQKFARSNCEAPVSFVSLLCVFDFAHKYCIRVSLFSQIVRWIHFLLRLELYICCFF